MQAGPEAQKSIQSRRCSPERTPAPAASLGLAFARRHCEAYGSRTVAVARHAIPSPRPVKPSRFGRRRLDRDAADVNAGDLGDAGAHRLAMRTDLGRLADERRVEMDDEASARAHPLRRMRKEKMRSRAFPSGIGGREMGADVALGERAVDRVGERMQRHVRVRMAAQGLRVGTCGRRRARHGRRARRRARRNPGRPASRSPRR